MALKLPPPETLERLCRGLATLDAALSEDWEYRYYSFNSKWNVKRKERMASMRDGCGDDWFIVFEKGGVFLKGFCHELKRTNAKTVFAGLPKALAPQLKEPAFSMEDVSFGGFFDGEWTLRGDAKAMKETLSILTGGPKAYRAYAEEYFELKPPLDAITQVLDGAPLDAKLLKRLKSERTLADMKDDLKEIGTGR